MRYFSLIQNIFLSVSMAFVPVMFAKTGSYMTVFLVLVVFIPILLILLQFNNKTFDPERQEMSEEGQPH